VFVQNNAYKIMPRTMLGVIPAFSISLEMQVGKDKNKEKASQPKKREIGMENGS
jgi:hypothetical protein